LVQPDTGQVRLRALVLALVLMPLVLGPQVWAPLRHRATPLLLLIC